MQGHQRVLGSGFGVRGLCAQKKARTQADLGEDNNSTHGNPRG
jgi:hypothetical protein